MTMTDPIADMLTRIRNGNKAMFDKVDIPASNLKEDVAKVLKRKGYISDYKRIEDHKQGILRVYLKYSPQRERVINGIKRVSTPGRRVYAKADKLPRVLDGLGMAVISTSRGLMGDAEARKARLGGEVICYVW